MTLDLQLPESLTLKPRITVFGIGGAGGNAVNNMISSRLEGVEFVIANTDAQALENALSPNRLQLGEELTRGLGAGASPNVGSKAAEESVEEINKYLEGTNMVFITAGMGGGTGTGAAPVIARMAKDRGLLTVGVVTKPFHFEGAHRMRIAEVGIHELQQHVDTLIVIPNQNLFRIANEKTTFADAFKMADSVLHAGVRGITDLMMMPGLINLDFADIRTVMSEMGKAMMGTGEAEGPDRARLASEAAISNPLLDNVSMKGARGVLINITGGGDMTLFEVDEAANRIREEVDPDANIIFGSAFNPDLDGKLRVSVVATGIDAEEYENARNRPAPVYARNQEKASTAAVAAAPVVASAEEEDDEDFVVTRSVLDLAKNQVEEENTATSFIAPRPATPEEVPATATVAAPTIAAAPSLRGARYEEDDVAVLERPSVQTAPRTTAQTVARQPQAQQKPMSLFGRMAAGMGIGRTAEEEELADVRATPQVSRNTPGQASQEEILDIPAFLRRAKRDE